MPYAEEQTAAIRMVAFGVLEAEVAKNDPPPIWASPQTEAADEVERLVLREFTALGWKLANSVERWRGRNYGKYVLLGPLTHGAAFAVRPRIGEGNLREVCLCAVHYLDTGKTNSKSKYAE